jgi:hypothetical protein
MEPNNFTNYFTLYLLLLLTTVFVAVDALEFYKLIEGWRIASHTFSPEFFSSCIKYPLLTQFGFNAFSILAAMSSFLFIALLAINTEFFTEKLIRSFIYMNCIIFGPWLLGATVCAIIHWEDVLYVCDGGGNNSADDKNNYKSRKMLSITTSFNLIGCLLLSLVITLSLSIYETVVLIIDSILRKPEGSAVVKKCFWGVVLRNRQDNINMQRRNNN